MHVQELQALPVANHKTLNPKLWDDHQLKPDIRSKLLQIAKHFIEFINIPNLDLTDITISGSNASYGYSEHSDLDLHLIARIPKDHLDLKELFNAKKNQYNNTYHIKLKGIPVELYVQDSSEPHHSAGIFSVQNNKWLSKPKEVNVNVDPKEIKSKARSYASKINQALRSNDLNNAKDTMDHIYRLRKAGLEAGGEYSVENLAFKLLRSRGQIDKLRNRINKLQSAELSLGERR
jgi:hypothetical protein